MTNKNFKEKLKEVDQIKITKNSDILEIINSLKNTGFNAKRLAIACDIYKQMIEDKECIKFFSLAGALVPAGMQKIIHDFIENGFIDVLITTGATLTHDIAETLGFHHLQGDIKSNEIDDAKLCTEEINRIYDVFMPNETYEGIEDFIAKLTIPDKNVPVSDFLKYLGTQLPDHPNSILKVCAQKNIPIYCPAFTDSGLALQLGFHNKQLNLNHFKDMLKMVDLTWEAKKSGVCIIGGGVPKNFVMQSLQFCPHPAQYAIQITMDRPETGGLSGATLQEAISWGKISANANYVTVILDASIALPIIFWYLIKSTAI
jgi:deoxyhypusine synthase